MSAAVPGSILFTGAEVGDMVEGMTAKNLGLILKIRQRQEKGDNGWLKGRFDVIETGNGTYANHIKELVGETMNAKEMVAIVLEQLGATSKRRLTILDRNSLRVKRT